MRLAVNNVVACLGGADTRLEARPQPIPGPGELVLRLRVVGLCGTDLFKLAVGSEAPGTVLGHEVVGEVIGLGEGVDEFALGDRVVVPHHVPCGECVYCERGNETMCETFRKNLMVPGGFADTILIDERAVSLAARRVAGEISDDAAGFMEPAACVLRGVRRSGLTANGLAVVQGAGSMGLLHLLVLRAAISDVRVMMIDPVEERRKAATDLGADEAVTPEEAAERLGDVGADTVFDTVGGAVPLQAALGLTRQGGTVVLFAHAPDGEAANFDLNDLFKYERRVIGTYSGALKEQAEIFDLISLGKLDPTPLATHRMPLDDFDRGVALMQNREALKVLFTPSKASLEPE
ncbi:MAG TPA: hypothetical protein DCE33_11040 [Rhodospirillaceae bacterium]|nr:hypothetical protein [Rhodospirillaceae bacterium]